MTDFVRRLVSGNKARFRDEELDLDLDLAYITDRVIVMGFPATGLEGLYRNRREDAKKFLDHHHGSNYWVFNFCPVKENSYPPEVFDGRVSRYPFPDHHAPPLAVLPLVAREIRAWLDASPEHVVVLHCKAGKGRSGTMACAYLLTLTDLPQPPSVGRSRAVEEKAKQRAEDMMNAMPTDVDASVNAEPQSDASSTSSDPIKHGIAENTPDTNTPDGAHTPLNTSTKSTTSLDDVFKLHTAGRMKPPSTPTARVKPGVSIPSQRRWLYYWSLLLAQQGPRGLWAPDTDTDTNIGTPAPRRVRLTQLAVRMHELPGVKAQLVRAASTLLDRAGRGKLPGGTSQVWASLARYDDALVGRLEAWERATRGAGGGQGAETQPEGAPRELFATPQWDRGKMVRPFARLGTLGAEGVQKAAAEEGKLVTYTLRPLSDDSWTLVKAGLEPGAEGAALEAEQASIQDATRALDDTGGVVLDAHREVRVKLYMGQVFMAWFWFVPAFHMPPPPPHTPQPRPRPPTTLRLARKELDFPLGVGAHLVDVAAQLEWCAAGADADVLAPPPRASSEDGDPTGAAAALHAAAAGDAAQAVDAAQVGRE